MKAIVTVKLPRNPNHNPMDKYRGWCPLPSIKQFCTDVTGQHHSYIEEGFCLDDIKNKAESKYKYVTRIEIIE